jgi:hypothetical protein
MIGEVNSCQGENLMKKFQGRWFFSAPMRLSPIVVSRREKDFWIFNPLGSGRRVGTRQLALGRC